jgi:hypothetical protein
MARNNRGGGSNRGRSNSGGDSRSMMGGYSRMISDRPATAAAIASGVAAAVVGFLAFKRSGKSFSEFSGDITSGASTRIKDGIAEVKSRASGWSEPRKDGLDDERSQSEIAEEALTRKAIGKKKAKRPVDPTIEAELKTGAISY